MGCKGSKDVSTEDKKIDSKFETTGYTKFDQLFEQASTILEGCEKIRGGLEDSKEDGAAIAGTDQLKDAKYVETLKVLLWSISAQGKGKILDMDVEPVTEKPFLKVAVAKLNKESKDLYNTFTEYVNTVTESPESLKTNVTKLQELVEMIPEAVKGAQSELEASTLSFKEKMEGGIKIKKNSQKLPKQLEKCKRLTEVLKEAGVDLKETVPELKNLVDSADEIGAKANTENLYKPKEIFDKFHTGAKPQAKTAEKKEAKSPEKSAKKDETKDETPAETKTEAKTETHAETKPETHAETKPETHAEPKAETHVEHKEEAHAEHKEEAHAEPKAETHAEEKAHEEPVEQVQQ